MTRQNINIGTSEGQGDGDSLRAAFQKINDNFTELYSGALRGFTGSGGYNGYSGSTGYVGSVGLAADAAVTNFGTFLNPSGYTLQVRRGSILDRTSFTPAAGEIIYSTDTKRLYVGDGVTPGGRIISGTVGYTGSGGGGAGGGYTGSIGLAGYTGSPGASGGGVTTSTLVYGTYTVSINTGNNLSLDNISQRIDFADTVTTIYALDPDVNGGVGGLNLVGKERLYATIQDSTGTWSYNWDFRSFGLNSVTNSKPTIRFPGNGYLMTDFTSGFGQNRPVTLASSHHLNLVAGNNEEPGEYGGYVKLSSGLGDAGYGNIIFDTGDYEFTFGNNGKLVLNPVGAFIDASVVGTLSIQSANTTTDAAWDFDASGILTFPDGSTSTGATIYVPYATSSTFRITTEVEMGPPPYIPLSFEVMGDRIILPNGNGLIQSGPFTDPWSLDSTNKTFTFPNNSDIYYGDGTTLSTGTLQVRIDFGGEFSIFLHDSNKTWTFNNSGKLILPEAIVGFTPPMGYERVVLQPSPAVQDSFLFYVDQTAGTFNRAGMEMPYADEDKAVTLAFPHNNNTVGYIFNQGTDTISGTALNNALNIMMNAGDVKITALSAGPTYTSWTFQQNGGLEFPDSTTQTTAFIDNQIGLTWSISASGASDYVFSGPGIHAGNTNDPILYLYRGFTYKFINTTGGSHPFAIRVSNGGAAYTTGVSGSQTGTQTFTVPMDAPSTLYYQCTIHSGMGNTINIV